MGIKKKIHNKFITAYIIQHQLIAALPTSTTNKPFITQPDFSL